MNWIALSVVAAGSMQASAIHHQTSAFILESHEKELRNFIYSNNYLKVREGFIDKHHCYLTCTGNKTGGVYDICVDPLTFVISFHSGYLLLVGALPLFENETYPDELIHDVENFESARLQYLHQSVFIVNEIVSSKHRLVRGHPINDNTISYTCVLSQEEYDHAEQCGYVHGGEVNWAELSPIIQADHQVLLQSTRDYKIVKYNRLTADYYYITIRYLDNNETCSGICDSDFYHKHNKDTYYDATYKRFVNLEDKEFDITKFSAKQKKVIAAIAWPSLGIGIASIVLWIFVSAYFALLLLVSFCGFLAGGLSTSFLQRENYNRLAQELSTHLAQELKNKYY